ncbi:hypothetical protein SUGI_0068830 [Cryptomeria japonica]|nr:hypothetical protein SUGI_0068830 [Cryptomeria japonica]
MYGSPSLLSAQGLDNDVALLKFWELVCHYYNGLPWNRSVALNPSLYSILCNIGDPVMLWVNKDRIVIVSSIVIMMVLISVVRIFILGFFSDGDLDLDLDISTLLVVPYKNNLLGQ